MRRNGLSTRAKRLARQKQQKNRAARTPEPAAIPEEREASDNRPVISPPANPGSPPEIHRALFPATEQHKRQPRKKTVPGKSPGRQARQSSRIITLVNAALILLAVFIGYRNVESFLAASHETAQVEPVIETSDEPIAKTTPSPKPLLSSYRAIWERNLFNVSLKEKVNSSSGIDLASVDVADDSIGLKLLGTVAANVAANRFAVIETLRGQEILHEGSSADGFVIKKILRKKVIVASAEGNMLLALTSKDRDVSPTAGQGHTAIALSSPEGAEPASRNPAGGRFRSVELPYEELTAGLEDVDLLIQEVGTRPYSRFGRSTGFRIESVPSDSILKRIGLRSHDAILAINGVPLKDESEAFAFFEKIGEGERTFIKYRRRARTRTIEINPI
jgi:type II secretion system protein C